MKPLAFMLSVGREINIETKNLLCRKCAWQGCGVELSTGLLKISHSDIYVYAYCCPECGTFDIVSKGKLLAFPSRKACAMPDTPERTAGGEAVESRLRRRN